MNFNFNIKIFNSFNKKNNPQDKENSFSDTLTLDDNKNMIETTSASVSSLTNDQELNNNIIISRVNNRKSNLFLRDIIVGVVGSVLGAIITYFILSVI